VNVSWRRPLTQTALLLMESLWAYALVGFFVALTVRGDRPTAFGVAFVVFLSFAVSRLLQGSTMSLLPLRIWGGAISLLLFYAIVRVDFFGDWRLWDFTWADALFNHTEATLNDKANAVVAIPVLWLLWLRGIIKGQQSLIFEEIVNSFALGIIVIAIAALFSPAVDAPASVGNVAIPYIAVGLLTIGFAHASRSEKEFGRSFDMTWLAALAGAVVVLTLTALLFTLIDFGAIAAAIGWAGEGIGWLIARTAYYILWPLVVAMDYFFQGLAWLRDHLWGGQRPQELLQQASPTPAPEEDQQQETVPQWLQFITRLVIGGFFAAVVLIALALVFVRYARRRSPDEVKESTYQEGRLASDLGEMLGSLLGRLRPSFRSISSEPMRRLYFDMLSAAAERGVERRPSETPLDVAPRVGRTFQAEVTNRITDAFDEARYGGVSPPAPEVRRLREEWDQARR